MAVQKKNSSISFADDLAELIDNISIMTEEVNPDTSKEINESETLFKEVKESYNKVDNKLIDFISNFVENQNVASQQKKSLKTIFFWFTMVLFAIIVITPIICLILMLIWKVPNYYVIFGSLVASVVEVLTTVIVLPRIVAEYLFNKEEEKANLQIVQLMQKYSETIHGYDNELKK
jgi:uncharacterized membrane protein YcjF (UPF0283 family)